MDLRRTCNVIEALMVDEHASAWVSRAEVRGRINADDEPDTDTLLTEMGLL